MNEQKDVTRGKKVDVIVKYFYPVVAGIETNIFNVYDYLASRGWDVTIHTSTDTPERKNSLPAQDTVGRLPIRRYPWHWYGIVADIRWSSTDAVALHNFNVFPHMWILSRVLVMRMLGRRTPKIFLVPHGGFTPGWWTFPWYQMIIKKIYQRCIGTFLINRTVDAYRSVSEWESAETVKNGVRPELVETIQNGIEKEAFTDVEKLASEEIRQTVAGLGTYIVQVGRIHPIKNNLTTIKALSYLPEDIHFAIAGPVTDAAYRKELEATVRDLKLENRVHFLGVVRGIDKYYLLKHSLANVHMASWESYCNAMHESMSQGCVCVVARGTASEELIRDGVNGYAVGVDDAEAVAEKVRYVYENRDSDLFREMRQRNIEFTLDHSWERIAQRVERLYLSSWGATDAK